MNKNVARVIKGILNLTAAEKEEFLQQLSELEKYPTLTKQNIERALNESFEVNKSQSVSLGPNPTGCPCCGK